MTIEIFRAPSSSSVSFFLLALRAFSINHFINHTISITWIASENRIVEKVVQSPSCLDFTSSEQRGNNSGRAHMDHLHRLVGLSKCLQQTPQALQSVCFHTNSSRFWCLSKFSYHALLGYSQRRKILLLLKIELWECGNFQNGSKPSRADGKGGQGGS